MPRPPHCRRIACRPRCELFKPAGIPARQLSLVTLSLDELEALRLADLGGLYQEQAAAHMRVSRQTFGRIIAAARRKVAEALIEGKALEIQGGVVEFEPSPRSDRGAMFASARRPVDPVDPIDPVDRDREGSG